MYFKSLEKFTKFVPFLLRIGLGLIFFWFGFTKFTNLEEWLAFIPPWIESILPISINSFLYIQGAIETLIGILLIIGILVRLSSFVAALILITIIFTLGFNDLALRDFGLLMMALSLIILGSGELTIKSILRKSHNQ